MIRDTETGTVPVEVLSSPALLFLYYRIEQILGIRANSGALMVLNEYIEAHCGGSFIERPGAYEQLLASREHIFEISKIVTINETYFFREGVHLKLFTRHFLPHLAKLGRPIEICSAASSIGCEAYSIAMALDYYRKNNRQESREDCPFFDFEIDAFDISSEAIETAKHARYTPNTLRADGADWKYILDSYSVPDGNEFIISSEIREKVHFFPHNIMRGFEKRYDVIFFRNAMIYFSARNRIIVMDAIANALHNDGLLFLGVSETSSVRHPLLINRYLSDVFFFQKTGQVHSGEPEIIRELRKSEPPSVKTESLTARLHKEASIRQEASIREEARPPTAARPRRHKQGDFLIDCGKVAAILEQEEGAANAKKILAVPADGQQEAGGSELAAAIVFFLSAGDSDSAGLVLSRLEKKSSAAVTRFLRGEYYFLLGNTAEAEKKFDEAAVQDKAFWPAFYRFSSIAADGNRALYEYKLKKALESLELGKDKHYECFFGGFSPDYFRQIIEKKLG